MSVNHLQAKTIAHGAVRIERNITKGKGSTDDDGFDHNKPFIQSVGRGGCKRGSKDIRRLLSCMLHKMFCFFVQTHTDEISLSSSTCPRSGCGTLLAPGSEQKN